MAKKRRATKGAQKSKGFSDEERAAVRELVRERKTDWGKNRTEDERAVLAKIAEMPELDRTIGRRIHDTIRSNVPALSPRLWYGMPAYTKDGDVLCYYQPAHKFKARYGSLGFSDKAKLDEGRLWPIAYALSELTPTEEATIASLVKKAAG
jgi:uncharacterized protein YdhG (YjbR/CyaY superfamily)